MKHLILGTAGHVDHGKTALVKALTGIDCDTHKEEKLRGITINLGFAHLELPSGDSISIVDVPGHRDFINTMVSGASGIDLAMLVIAADSGVMPQTREHLQIMQILGIRTGLIVITRIDLAEPDIITMAEAESAELVSGTFLENCPIVKVSSKTGEGINMLHAVIQSLAAGVTERPRREVFRMYIDRIFSVSGFGTVVTGSVLGGSIHTGNTAWLLPSGKELRVRRLERHGLEVPEVTAGDRASMNLVGLSREDFDRGMLVADRLLRTTELVDARLKLFDHARPVGLWCNAMFLMGTFEAQARVHLIDHDVLRGSEEGIVQIHLPSPCVAQAGDRFVIRTTSSDISLGGGEIIDASPLHHRRRPAALVETLSRIAAGKLPELIAAEVRKHPSGISLQSISDVLNVAPAEVTAIADAPLPDTIHTLGEGGERFFITAQDAKRLTDRISSVLTAHHRRNPLERDGKTVEELVGILGMDNGPQGLAILRALLVSMERRHIVKRSGHTWALAGHTVETGPDLEKHIGAVEQFLSSEGMKTPLLTDLQSLAARRDIDERMLKQILRYLVSQKKIYTVDNNYLHASVVDNIRIRLLRKLAETPEGLTVAQFRDLVNGNRKICLLLYALFDTEGITERKGDTRIITEKGILLLETAGTH